MYMSLLISRILKKYRTKISAEGLRDIIKKELSHIDSSRYKLDKIQKIDNVFYLPYEREEKGQINKLILTFHQGLSEK